MSNDVHALSDVHTLSGAYALDALMPEEAEEFDGHLAACEACRIEVREFRDAAARMGAAEALTPPPALKERVMAAVDRTPQLPPAPLQAARPRRERRASLVGSHADGARHPLRWVAAVAAAVVLVGMGVVGVRTLVGDQPPQLSTAASEVFTSADVRTATVQTANGGKLRLGVSPKLDEMAVDTRDLPALDSSHVYQVWAVHDGSMRSAAILADPDAGAAMSLPGPDTTVAVTVEPKGGSKQPTTKPIVQVDPSAL